MTREQFFLYARTSWRLRFGTEAGVIRKIFRFLPVRDGVLRRVFNGICLEIWMNRNKFKRDTNLKMKVNIVSTALFNLIGTKNDEQSNKKFRSLAIIIPLMLLPTGHPTFLRLAGLNLKGFNQHHSDKFPVNLGSWTTKPFVTPPSFYPSRTT
jgi:hypothetical protein